MENGENINNYGVTPNFYDDGLNFRQAAIIVPSPKKESQYYIFHQPVDWNTEITTHFPRLYYSIADMSLNNGLGALLLKDQLIIEDTLLGGKLTATKHANGRDWWIVTGEEDQYTNVLYSFLLSPEGVGEIYEHDVGPSIEYEVEAGGQSVITPDGSKYIRHDTRFDPFSAIDIYDFDRCTGTFVHNTHFELEDTTGLSGGVAVSPDSRYLYIITRLRVYQYDLMAEDIVATQDTIAEYDGYVAYWFESAFTAAQLAPNGKIYFASSSSDTVMHIIHTPGQPGELAHVEQHGLALPNLNDKSIPNFPNYRLGPFDGSPCDTLGLDNFPMAGFSHYADGLTVYFSDNSYYRPESWDWDFGDSQGSTERNPIHEYELPGEYEVCLTVANENGEDTHCRWVVVDSLPPIVGAVEDLPGASVHLWPNPASNQLKIRLLGMTGTGGHRLQLYDMAGRKVKSWDLAAGQTDGAFWLGGVAEGLYIWELSGSGVARVLRQRLAVGKLMVKG